MKTASLFDSWPETYDQWFETPIGKLIKTYETELILEMLAPSQGDHILDAGCGTGVFSQALLSVGARIVGLELSLPMLLQAGKKASGPVFVIQGDMNHLPFSNSVFDKAVSVTAIEFISDAQAALNELFRVTKPGGRIVVATLNRLSPWAKRRKRSGARGHSLFREAIFRSSDEMRQLTDVPCVCKTAIHFQKHEAPEKATQIEANGRSSGLDTGAFLACSWQKP